MEFQRTVPAQIRSCLIKGRSPVDQGKKPADLASLQLPTSVKNWVGDDLATQAKDAYEEITQGKPHGEIVGGK
jgi:hypothetical protein